MIFNLTEHEHHSGRINKETLSAIVNQIETQGYAVVNNLISPETCDLLNTAILEDVELVRASDKPTPHEIATGQGHLQLGLRRFAPYVRSDLVANPLIENIVAGVLGPGAWLGFYNGNVNCPASVHQPLHFDRPFSWKTPEEAAEDNQNWPPPTTTLSCSVALSEITETNGATEIYPGTHHETAVTKWPSGERISNHPELIEQWGPAERMTIPVGGICFRDPRMWHRGVPNPTNRPRPMIALTYHSEKGQSWRGLLAKDMDPEAINRCRENPSLRLMDDGTIGDGRLVFEENTREAFTSKPTLHQINRNIRFVGAPQRVNHFRGAHLVGGARVVDDGDISPSG